MARMLARLPWLFAAHILLGLTTSVVHASGAIVPVAGSGERATMIITGASYAASWGTPPLPGRLVINRGVGGQQTAQMRDRFEQDVVAAKPQQVLIWGHINNVTQSNIAFAPPERAAEIKRAAEDDYRAMVGQARRAGIAVILATEIPLAEPAGLLNEIRALVGRMLGRQSYAEKVNAHVRDLNAFVRELGAREKLRVLDFEKVLAPDGGARRPAYATDDLSHVTPAGYEALTRYATRELGRRP
jgi:lysophospholipase L1-like esterase